MTAVASATDRPATAPGRSVGLPQVIRSEWTKLWSVRSTTWSLLALVVVTVGFSALFCWGAAASADTLSPQERATFDATTVSLSGLSLGQLAMAVMGVLAISSEYSTGGIRTTLVAVPNRERLLLAKAVVVTVVALGVGTIACFASFFVGQVVLGHYGMSTTLGQPHVLRAVIGGGLYLLMSGLFGFALGAVLRHSAGSIVATVALLLVVPPLLNLLPGTWGHTITKYFTSNAGQQITNATNRDPTLLSPWHGYLAFAAETLLVFLVGLVLIRRRDA
jgi:ABC-type transport system involved in multi-copper enzyme maturation permease subunit